MNDQRILMSHAVLESNIAALQEKMRRSANNGDPIDTNEYELLTFLISLRNRTVGVQNVIVGVV